MTNAVTGKELQSKHLVDVVCEECGGRRVGAVRKATRGAGRRVQLTYFLPTREPAARAVGTSLILPIAVDREALCPQHGLRMLSMPRIFAAVNEAESRGRTVTLLV